MARNCPYLFFFFFNDTTTTEIYTLSLHDALPISSQRNPRFDVAHFAQAYAILGAQRATKILGIFARLDRRDGKPQDRKSTRLNSSHANISYAVFCLKKKKKFCLSISVII